MYRNEIKWNYRGYGLLLPMPTLHLSPSATTATTTVHYTPSSTKWLNTLFNISPRTPRRKRSHQTRRNLSIAAKSHRIHLRLKLIPQPYVSIHDHPIHSRRPRAKRDRRILRLSSLAEWDTFHDRYAIVSECAEGFSGYLGCREPVWGDATIDWDRVQTHYAGIRVRPSLVHQYLGQSRDRWATVVVNGKRYTSWLDGITSGWHPFQIWEPECVVANVKPVAVTKGATC